ncbi:hypothetical protein P5673_002960 [Acropora cervicornis]|uniref:Uncharacterized protein n=1 Tax=Acropora cervicornis TaxID=6130 RepID=A0AAD9R1W0_ACRCE|nr:hypothetical protein P5673_002960 [Acropora cervicornis]
MIERVLGPFFHLHSDVFLCWCPTFSGYLGQGILHKKIDETEKKNNMFANLHPNLPENVDKSLFSIQQ